MSRRLPVSPAPEPLEGYVQHFDSLFAKWNQRAASRRYLEGLLLPAERNKTFTALANTEPVVGAHHRCAQGLQWFLSESTWQPKVVNRQRVRLLRSDPATAQHSQGVLVIDESGDRNDGKKTAHVDGLRMWVERCYKQVKHALGWAEYQVRSDVVIRRHWALVWCSFSFSWWHLGQGALHAPAGQHDVQAPASEASQPEGGTERAEYQAATGLPRPAVCWPQALRKVRAWLEPWLMLGRYWRAWSQSPHRLNSRYCSPECSLASRSTSMNHFDPSRQSTVRQFDRGNSWPIMT